MNTRRIALMAMAALALAACATAQTAQTVGTTVTPKVVMSSTASHFVLPQPAVAPATGDQQAPPPPPAPPVPPTAPRVVGGVTGGVTGGVAGGMPMPGSSMQKVQIRQPRGQSVNIKVEFTITDQVGSKAPVRKTIMTTVADGYDSRIRSQVQVARKDGASYAFRSAPLSIDVTPVVEGSKIRIEFGLEYNLLDDAPADGLPGGNTSVTERVVVLLDSGVSAIVAQSADPVSDRKVTVEVKATILK